MHQFSLPKQRIRLRGYDNNDNLQYIAYPSGLTVFYGYNSRNQINRIYNFNGGEIKNIEYFTPGAEEKKTGLLKRYTRSNNTTINFTYDDRRRQVKRKYPLTDLNYDFNARGNLVNYSRTGSLPLSVSCTYDEINRLSTYSGPWGFGAYRYQPSSDNRAYRVHGNTTSPEHYSADYYYSGKKLTRYDILKKGVLTTKNFGYSGGDLTTNGNLSLVYDIFHQLIESKSGTSTLATYQYDASGNRSQKKLTANGKDNTLYHYDGTGRILSECDGDNIPLYDYIYLYDTMVAKVKNEYQQPKFSLVPVIYLLTRDEQ